MAYTHPSNSPFHPSHDLRAKPEHRGSLAKELDRRLGDLQAQTLSQTESHIDEPYTPTSELEDQDNIYRNRVLQLEAEIKERDDVYEARKAEDEKREELNDERMSVPIRIFFVFFVSFYVSFRLFGPTIWCAWVWGLLTCVSCEIV